MPSESIKKRLPIDKLDLDKDNPRIRKWIEQYGDSPSFEHMLLALGAGSTDTEGGSTTFQSLKDSIRAQGGIINPVIVVKNASGRYTVIEGNTRVAIFRSFRDDKIPGDWNTIPAMVNDDLPKIEIDAIRLQCHIVGPRQWDPYSKAKYLDSLLNTQSVPLQKIIDLCGGRKKEIVDYIEAYRDMEKYYRPVLTDDGQFDASRFSAFVELQKPGIKQAIFEASFTLSDFAHWVNDRKIDPLNTVRAVPRILKNAQAKAKFLAVGAREALKVLDVPPSPELNNVPLDQLLRVAIEKLNTIPYTDVKALKADSGGQKAQLLFEAQEILAEICKDIAPE